MLIQLTPEGLRIQLVELEGKLLFEIGSAEVRPPLVHLLRAVAVVLAPLPNTVAVEGHTDGRQYARQGYSNWELSAERANAARRVLEAAGLRPGRIDRIVSHADRDPLSEAFPSVAIPAKHEEGEMRRLGYGVKPRGEFLK